MTATNGNAGRSRLAVGYQKLVSAIPKTRHGFLSSLESGAATAYSIENAQERGTVCIKPTQKVYAGQIVGLNLRKADMEVNICKEKKLTNVRSSSSAVAIQLTPPTILSLEESLDFLEDDELLEVTPQNLRLRKRFLLTNERKKNRK